MPFVLVSGFPKEEKMIVRLRSYLNAAKLTSKYWVTEVIDMHSSNTKEITIDFKSFNEASKAEEYINTVPYNSRSGREYYLTAKITDLDEWRTPEEYNGLEGRYNRSPSREYSNKRSYSPLKGSSKLDIEIELLRKKKLLIEEERKLLLEKRKLEMIKEFGFNASSEFNACANREFGKNAPILFRTSRDRKSASEQQAQPRQPLPQNTALAHIPQFVLPCKIILSQMKKAMKRKVPVIHERTMLKKVISASLRRRFAIVLENQSYMPSDAITKLYRQVYPLSTDEEFIDKKILDVKSCHWPKRVKSQKTLNKIARSKEEKMKFKSILSSKYNKNTPGTNAAVASVTSTALEVANVKAETNDQLIDVKPNIKTEVAGEVLTKDIEAAPQDQTELNATMTSETKEPHVGSEEDWIENGVDWNNDDEEV